jgi:hypothetical protein
MNPVWSIDPSRRLVIVEYTSTGTYEDWEACMKAILADPEWVPGFRILVDRLQSAPPLPQDAHRMVAFRRRHLKEFGKVRWAVVSGQLAELGMVRMRQALSTDIPGEIDFFQNRAEALDWLLDNGHQVA